MDRCWPPWWRHWPCWARWGCLREPPTSPPDPRWDNESACLLSSGARDDSDTWAEWRNVACSADLRLDSFKLQIALQFHPPKTWNLASRHISRTTMLDRKTGKLFKITGSETYFIKEFSWAQRQAAWPVPPEKIHFCTNKHDWSKH